MYFCALGEAVANYGVHYGSYCKLWGLGVADLVYWVQDKQLFCIEMQLQLIGRAHNAPACRGVLLCNSLVVALETDDRSSGNYIKVYPARTRM